MSEKAKIEEILAKLQKLQVNNPAKPSNKDIVKLVREDRKNH
jgi:ubiquitin-protein ligase